MNEAVRHPRTDRALQRLVAGVERPVPRLADQRSAAVEQQHVDLEPVQGERPADAGSQSFLPVVSSEKRADRAAGVLGKADRRRDLHGGGCVVGQRNRAAPERLAAERGAGPLALSEHLTERARVGGRHHPAGAVDAEEIEVRRAVVDQRAQKARDAFVQVADHDVPHDVLVGPVPDVVALLGQVERQLFERPVRHLTELLTDGVLERIARAHQRDHGEQQPRDHDEHDREDLQLRAQGSEGEPEHSVLQTPNP